jgi:phosphomannomutase/phosphoglucomutase
MNPEIFRPNDIRGVIDQDFTVEDFTLIGQGFAKFLLDREVRRCVVGRDNRLSSPNLQSAFIAGLISSGIDTVDIGEITTPMSYFARELLQTNGSACVTASHNPPNQNGLKLCFGNGAIHEDEIIEVSEHINRKHFEKGEGKISTYDIVPDYLNNIRRTCEFDLIKASCPIKTIATDSGNGLAGKWVPGLLRELGMNVFELHSRPDGTFPNHLPDPELGQNMKELWRLCHDQNEDLGLAFDGDVDRLNAIDDNQTILWGDGLTMFFAREVLERLPNSEILYDVMSSPGLPEDITTHHGKPVLVAPGHSLVAHKLHLVGAPMAGEYSGHHYFMDGYLGFDDAIYSTFRILKILSQKKMKLSEAMRNAPFYYSSTIINVPVAFQKEDMIVRQLQTELGKQYFVDRTSGARVNMGNIWTSIHPSTTEGYIRFCVWGKSQAEVDQTRENLLNLVNSLL